MTNEEMKVAEAFQKCANVRLPDGFADRLVKRVRGGGDPEERQPPHRSVFTRIALIAASLTLLLGFVPNVFDSPSTARTAVIAQGDEICPVGQAHPQDSRLTALAILGFCREAIRRRVHSVFARSRKREDEE